MAHKNKTLKYPVDITCQNVSCLFIAYSTGPK